MVFFMANKAAIDLQRTSCVVQICITPEEKLVLTAYAEAMHDGKLSIAGRCLLISTLRRAIQEVAFA